MLTEETVHGLPQYALQKAVTPTKLNFSDILPYATSSAKRIALKAKASKLNARHLSPHLAAQLWTSVSAR